MLTVQYGRQSDPQIISLQLSAATLTYELPAQQMHGLCIVILAACHSTPGAAVFAAPCAALTPTLG